MKFNLSDPFSISDIASISQTLIAFGSLILVVITIRLQNKSNRNQREIFKMDIKAKRAEYMPTYSIRMGKVYTSSKEDGYGGTIPGDDAAIYYELEIQENALTKVNVEFTNPDKSVFKEIDNFSYGYAFYKKGDKIGEHLLDFKDIDLEGFKAESDKNMQSVLTIRFEDLVGNKYIQSVVYNYKNNGTEILPLASDE